MATLAVWAERQALETETWTETSSELLEDEAIRDAVATFMVDTVFDNVDVQGELERALPPELSGLAGPAAAGLRNLSDRAAHQLLERPRVQAIWENLNRNAHAAFLEVVEGEEEDEPVTLDLSTIVDELGQSAGIDVAGRLPEDAGEIVILEPDQLSTAQEIVRLIEGLAVWLSLLAIGLMALAVYLAAAWRREALRAVGFAFIAIGVAVLIARALAGNAVVDSLATTAAVEPAVEDTWEIGTSLLATGGGALVFYGVFILLAAWLGRPGGAAKRVRREMAPVLERPGIAYTALLVALLLLFWWAPTEGFERLAPSVVLIILIVAGFELLRRQLAREFPEESWEAGAERWRAGGRSLLERRGGRA